MSDGSTNPKKAHGDKKPRQVDIPVPAAMVQGVAHYQGAIKYGSHNWREKPVDAITYIGAIKSHLDLFAMGEDEARDGTHHLAHIMASCGLLLDAWLVGTLVDNRRKLTPDQIDRVVAYAEQQKARVDAIFAATQSGVDTAYWMRMAEEEGEPEPIAGRPRINGDFSSDRYDPRPESKVNVNSDRCACGMFEARVCDCVAHDGAACR